MLKPVLIVLGLLLAQSSPSQDPQKEGKSPASSTPTAAPFGVKDVLDMLGAKVSEDIIIGQIIKANLRITLGTQDLVALTKAGASERVLHQLDASITISKPAEGAAAPAMAKLSAQPPAAKPEIRGEGDPNDPDAPHKPGIYLYTEKNGERKMVEINKTVPQSSRAKNTPFVSIVVGAYVYAFIPRPKAAIRTSARQPVFYFYVGETSQISGAVDSPGQVALVKMDPQTMQRLEGRRMAYAKVPHAFAQPIIGTDPKALRLFKSEQTGPQAFRLIPDAELESGEYCFFFNSATGGSSLGKGAAGENITLWDFGID
jgi:hypothetical protein